MASIMEAVSLLRTDIWYGRQVLSFFSPSLQPKENNAAKKQVSVRWLAG